MDAYLARIADIIKKGKISLRIKFMLQDVQELRDNGWVPPKHQILKKIGVQLKTIEQVSGIIIILGWSLCLLRGQGKAVHVLV